MRIFLLTSLCAISGVSLANSLNESCDRPYEKLPIAPEAEVVMSDCFYLENGPLECWMGLKMKIQHGEFTFSGISVEREKGPKAYLELRTFPNENESYIGTRLTGELSFIDGLVVYTTYNDGKGCGIVSTQRIKHNKERNNVDVTVVPPIR